MPGAYSDFVFLLSLLDSSLYIPPEDVIKYPIHIDMFYNFYILLFFRSQGCFGVVPKPISLYSKGEKTNITQSCERKNRYLLGVYEQINPTI